MLTRLGSKHKLTCRHTLTGCAPHSIWENISSIILYLTPKREEIYNKWEENERERDWRKKQETESNGGLREHKRVESNINLILLKVSSHFPAFSFQCIEIGKQSIIVEFYLFIWFQQHIFFRLFFFKTKGNLQKRKSRKKKSLSNQLYNFFFFFFFYHLRWTDPILFYYFLIALIPSYNRTISFC